MLKFFKVKKPVLKICLTFLFLVRAIVLYFFEFGCPWKNFLGIPCYGCGLTSAFFFVLQLDFLKAFENHFMFWSIPILYCYVWFDGKLTGKRKLDNIILFLLLAGFLARWSLYFLS